jgi:mono/diheme cytochrome c family protein
VVVLTVGVWASWASSASAADTAAGQALYKKRCAVCHGATGAADTPMAKMLKPPPPKFTDAQWMGHKSDEELEKGISEGKLPKMPAFGKKLSAKQIQDLVAHIRTLVK